MARSRRDRLRGPAAGHRTFVREGLPPHLTLLRGWVSPDRRQAMTGKGHQAPFPPPSLRDRCRFLKRSFAADDRTT
jgi:hypothetical protein